MQVKCAIIVLDKHARHKGLIIHNFIIVDHIYTWTELMLIAWFNQVLIETRAFNFWQILKVYNFLENIMHNVRQAFF